MMSISKKELANIYGIMLGDGCLSRYSGARAIVVTGSIYDDGPFFDKVVIPIMQKMRSKTVKYRFKPKYGGIEVNFSDKNLFEKFISMGFPVGVKKEIRIPKFLLKNGLGKHVVSGIFATDGSFVVTNNNGVAYPRIEFRSNSITLLRQIRTILRKYHMEGGLYPKYTRLQYNGKTNLRSFIKNVGFLNPKHTERYKQWQSYIKTSQGGSAW